MFFASPSTALNAFVYVMYRYHLLATETFLKDNHTEENIFTSINKMLQDALRSLPGMKCAFIRV